MSIQKHSKPYTVFGGRLPDTSGSHLNIISTSFVYFHLIDVLCQRVIHHYFVRRCTALSFQLQMSIKYIKPASS